MHICIIAYKRLIIESRLLRQVRTFRNRGWEVTLAGFVEPGDVLEEVNVLPLSQVQHKRSWSIPQALARWMLPAVIAWRLHPQNREARINLHGVAKHFDYIIAHDWECAPLAYELATKYCIPFGVDVHEYARRQFCPTGRWLRDWVNTHIHGGHAHAIQRNYLHLASGITTVCDGFADLLQNEYNLRKRPGVVRSVPFYQECPFRPCGERIRILYHGVVDFDRNLDVLLHAVPLLEKRYIVEIRGPAREEYLHELKFLAKSLGVGERVCFTTPVAFSQVVSEANMADIGYVVFSEFSLQRTYNLPNKFFENTMAGLALCVSGSQEMARLIDIYQHGVVLKDCLPEVVAKTLNALTRADINEMKYASLRAAKELCWEKEEKQMLAAYNL